jgi:hypothetical protein
MKEIAKTLVVIVNNFAASNQTQKEEGDGRK